MKDDTNKIPYVKIDRKIWQRIPHLDEERKCGDCGVRHGQYHYWGCDMERCPRCREQMISCKCSTNAHLAETLDYNYDKVIANPNAETVNYLIDEALQKEDIDLYSIKSMMMDIWNIDAQTRSDDNKCIRIIHRLVTKARNHLLNKIKRMEKQVQCVCNQEAEYKAKIAALAKDNHQLKLVSENLQERIKVMQIFGV